MIADWMVSVRRVLARACLLTAVSAAAGLGFNRIRPVGIPLRAQPEPSAAKADADITVHDAAEQLGAVLFVDARSRAAYDEGHLPGAVSLPWEAFETAFGEVAAALIPGIPLVTYCEGGDCIISHLLARSLRQGGYDDVRTLAGGFEAWIEAGFPVEQDW